MGVSTLSHSQSSSTEEMLTFSQIKNNLQKPGHWTFLIPTIGVVALGILLSPSVAIGLAAGAALFAVKITTLIVISSLGFWKKDPDSEHSKDLDKHPLRATILAPVIEETLFRGMIQPLAARAIQLIVPAASAAFLGTGLSIAMTVSIVATAALFGYAHLSNDHKNAHIQALSAGISGIGYGLLAAQFGLGASIAAHMTINTLLVSLARLVEPAKARTPHSIASTTAPDNGISRLVRNIFAAGHNRQPSYAI